jgi:uncharacterized protein YjiS (DUF1127 family)
MEMMKSTNSNTFARQNGAASSILGRLAAAPKRFWTAYITWRVQQAAIIHLKSMNGRELKDIGLSRSQIEYAVMGERARDHLFSRYY